MAPTKRKSKTEKAEDTSPLPQPEVKRMALAELEMADYNPRRIDDRAMNGLQASLREFGVIDMPVVNVHQGRKRLIGGHQRVTALRNRGYVYVDCVVVDFDDTTERMANLSLNNPAIQGRWDLAKALPVMDALTDVLPDTDDLGLRDLRKQMKVQASRNPKLRPTSPARQRKSEPISIPGTVYALGDHRLLCGDGANPSMLSGLLQDDNVDLGIVDPPYNVAYATGASGEADLENDDLQGDDWTAFVRSLCNAYLTHVHGATFIFFASKHLPMLENSWKTQGGVLQQWLVWVKDHPSVQTFRPTDFHQQFEWIMCGHSSKRKSPAYPDRTNVLSYPKPSRNQLHPTQKPLDLVVELIRDNSTEGQLVMDLTAGSGTTLMAAESCGRVCCAAEIDPHWCDNIRRRWAEAVHGDDCDWKSLTVAI